MQNYEKTLTYSDISVKNHRRTAAAYDCPRNSLSHSALQEAAFYNAKSRLPYGERRLFARQTVAGKSLPTGYAYFIFSPGMRGFTSTSSRLLTMSSVPCLYFLKCGVCKWLA